MDDKLVLPEAQKEAGDLKRGMEMNDAIKYLYSQFILRDVLSFITPGAIVVFTALFLYFPELPKQSIHWLLFIPLFGVFYMVGFAVQCLGEIFDIIRFTPGGQGSWGQRLRIFWVNWADERNIWWQKDYENDFDFFQNAKGKEYEDIGRGRERMVVLQQMCANGFLASAIAVLLFIIYYIGLKSSCYILIVVVPLILSLFWGYRVHVLRRYTRERFAIDRLDKQRRKDIASAE